MNTLPQKETNWRYTGPGPGKGEVQKVIYSAPAGPGEEIEVICVGPSHAFAGDSEEFAEVFAPAN